MDLAQNNDPSVFRDTHRVRRKRRPPFAVIIAALAFAAVLIAGRTKRRDRDNGISHRVAI